MPRRRSAVLAVCVLTVSTAACTSAKDTTPPEQVAAQAFLDDLGHGRAAQAAARTTDQTSAGSAIQQSLDGLGDGARGTLKVGALSARKDTSATASFTAAWTLPGASTPWKYTGSLAMTKQDKTWRVRWTPTAIAPGLQTGQHLQTAWTQPARAALNDSAGRPLFTATPVVQVGVEPKLVTNLATLSATLASVLGISAADIVRDVRAAKPTDFVPVITLRRTAYLQVKARIYNLPGTVFRSSTELLGPSSRFAQPMLGQVGDATAEAITKSKGTVHEGDQVGLSGLQQGLDETLRGTDGLVVQAVAATGSPKTLATVQSPKPGTPVTTTLDRTVQTAADATLANLDKQAAIVAVQPSTGKILAVANTAAAQGNIAMAGQYPAGSDFKIVTYTAAFTKNPSLTPSTMADCPGTKSVGGRVFENENKFDEGRINLQAAFAYSCNTTAMTLALATGSTAMRQAASALGVGAQWSLPIDAYSGQLPATTDQVQLAAQAIGQGTVLVSPLLMATVAGSAATGRTVAPSLVVGKQATPGPARSATIRTYLNSLMRAVVAEPYGTAHALADLPGTVQGKTGTAEFGTDVPPKSHSWMVGTRGDLAFAVFVYGGESSGTAAVPLAKTFLSAVPVR